MLVLAARRLRFATAIATRSWPKVSPPLDADAFDVAWLNGQDLVYICAHGMPDGDTLYGDGGQGDLVPMLRAETIRQARMPGAIVYLAGCYGQGPIADAFFAAGAACVVADRDVNWSGPLWPTGCNELGRLFLSYLRRGFSASAAFRAARQDYGGRQAGPRALELLDTVELLGDGDADLWLAGRRGAV